MNTPYEQAHLQNQRQRKHDELRTRIVRKAERFVRSILSVRCQITQQTGKLLDHSLPAQPAIADPTTTARLLGFPVLVGLAGTMEYLASGHAADALLETLSPALSAGPGGKQIFLTAFVAGLLTVTLGVKFVSKVKCDRLHEKMHSLQADESGRYWRCKIAIAGLRGVSVAYLALLAILYVWLFGFAREYANLLVKIDSAAEVESLVSGSAGLPPDNQQPVNPSNLNASVEQAATRIAASPAVFYAIIWCLHAILLWLPAGGVLSRVELAKARRLERKINSLKIRIGTQARALYQMIASSPEEHRDAVFDACRPVREEIIQAMSPRKGAEHPSRESHVPGFCAAKP